MYGSPVWIAARRLGRAGARAAKPGVSGKDAATVASIERKLTSHFGARVAVLHSPKKGRIVIEYRGNEDLQRLLEKLVDTPVRGFAYQSGGSAPPELLEAGLACAERASATWRIPVAALGAADGAGWPVEAAAAVEGLTGS